MGIAETEILARELLATLRLIAADSKQGFGAIISLDNADNFWRGPQTAKGWAGSRIRSSPPSSFPLRRRRVPPLPRHSTASSTSLTSSAASTPAEPRRSSAFFWRWPGPPLLLHCRSAGNARVRCVAGVVAAHGLQGQGRGKCLLSCQAGMPNTVPAGQDSVYFRPLQGHVQFSLTPTPSLGRPAAAKQASSS